MLIETFVVNFYVDLHILLRLAIMLSCKKNDGNKPEDIYRRHDKKLFEFQKSFYDSLGLVFPTFRSDNG